jgi:hypothetical protein
MFVADSADGKEDCGWASGSEKALSFSLSVSPTPVLSLLVNHAHCPLLSVTPRPALVLSLKSLDDIARRILDITRRILSSLMRLARSHQFTSAQIPLLLAPEHVSAMQCIHSFYVCESIFHPSSPTFELFIHHLSSQSILSWPPGLLPSTLSPLPATPPNRRLLPGLGRRARLSHCGEHGRYGKRGRSLFPAACPRLLPF